MMEKILIKIRNGKKEIIMKLKKVIMKYGMMMRSWTQVKNGEVMMRRSILMSVEINQRCENILINKLIFILLNFIIYTIL